MNLKHVSKWMSTKKIIFYTQCKGTQSERENDSRYFQKMLE